MFTDEIMNTSGGKGSFYEVKFDYIADFVLCRVGFLAYIHNFHDKGGR